jgi:hypothetical protein
VFANAGAAETWSDENDPEGVAFDCEAPEMAFSDWGRLSTDLCDYERLPRYFLTICEPECRPSRLRSLRY